MLNRRDAGHEGYTKGGMLDWWDAGKEESKIGRMKERRDAGKERFNWFCHDTN